MIKPERAPKTLSRMHMTARLYASRGWRVMPVRPSKAPAFHRHMRNGCTSATTDAALIDEVWGQYPDAGVGIATGPDSDLWVMDVDDPRALSALLESHGQQKAPLTRVVHTQGGGTHFYFTYAEGISNSPGKLPRGIDVRGAGGFVVAPPSVGTEPHRRYTLLWDRPVIAAPEWLLDAYWGRNGEVR